MEHVTLFSKQPQGILLSLKVCPKASRHRIGGVILDAQGKALLKVWVRTAPEDGKANQAVLQLLAKHFKLKKQQLSIVHGITDPYKTIRITPFNKQETVEALYALLETRLGVNPSWPDVQSLPKKP